MSTTLETVDWVVITIYFLFVLSVGILVRKPSRTFKLRYNPDLMLWNKSSFIIDFTFLYLQSSLRSERNSVAGHFLASRSMHFIPVRKIKQIKSKANNYWLEIWNSKTSWFILKYLGWCFYVRLQYRNKSFCGFSWNGS